ncbi:unnamed protein product [Medioppia subpectinata]|uniref:JmjC domain-containing protein n=1 Tax=Medioppia subpectinata TaxID=1979941 RepID=A0A7R9PY12_9ACAR|nr:unnamed protein product [Medioppia subpectinata]CAG2104586.1 unnamed protein product [Medioppia subpectinata]
MKRSSHPKMSTARSKVMNMWSAGDVTAEAIPPPPLVPKMSVSQPSPPLISTTHSSIVTAAEDIPKEPPKSDQSVPQMPALVPPQHVMTHSINGTQSDTKSDNVSVKSVDTKVKDISGKAVPKMRSKGFKARNGLPSNVKVIKTRTRPVLVKGFAQQKGFLDFVGRSYVLVKEGVPFIQDRSCKQLTSDNNNTPSATASTAAAVVDANTTTTVHNTITHCMDCNDKKAQTQACRFFQYRTLVKSNGQLSVYAFAEEDNATHDDCKLWLPYQQTSVQPMTETEARYLLTFVGEQFCQIYGEEQRVFANYESITWKRPVKGIRELCDICQTTIFNTHYVCPNCGLAICVDCHDVRKESEVSANPAIHLNRKTHDEFGWSLCHDKQKHDTNGLHLALFITKATFDFIDRTSHTIRNNRRISGVCGCNQLDPTLNMNIRDQCKDLDLITFYPHVPRQWYCNDRLLVLTEPKNFHNLSYFQIAWLRGFAVMIQNVNLCMKPDLWEPQKFNKSFGRQSSYLVNCMNGSTVPKRPMSDFWDGFEDIDKRIKDDETGEEMILKLKDWPPNAEFRDILPLWFDDLMDALPLPEYTKYNGSRNLAARLPDFFVRPDLGPKMYCAYGSVLHADKGTTNLHLDMSDAINVMVYVGVAQKDGQPLESHLKYADDTLRKGGCDEQMMQRADKNGLKVGALWHIWRAEDADKMRQFIRKVAKERHKKSDLTSDPIHDQSWYLDEPLRRRLETEYNVKGMAIAQCLGDAILVPAGAPHQVQNIHSCIKVAGEFVSPENVGHCVALTQEFRKLSKRHTNHEDKLQIKNIIYHTIKDSLSTLMNPNGPPMPSMAQSPSKVLPNGCRPHNGNVRNGSDLCKSLPPQTTPVPTPASFLTPPNSVEKSSINEMNGQKLSDSAAITSGHTIMKIETSDESSRELSNDCEMTDSEAAKTMAELLPPLLTHINNNTMDEQKVDLSDSPPILEPYSTCDDIKAESMATD